MTTSLPIPGTPLAGCVMLVTADRRSAELATALERRGALVQHAPSLTVIPHIGDEDLVEQTRAIIRTSPDIVVATTGVGFTGWMETADTAGLHDELRAAIGRARFIARGPKARGAIQQAGFTADWVAESETSAELGEYLLAEGIDGSRIVVQHHGSGADGLDEAFESAGATVASLVVYRWGPPPDPGLVARSAVAAAAGEYDTVIFTSAPGTVAWLDAARSSGSLEGIVDRSLDGSLLLAAVGPITAAPLIEVGIDPLVPDRGRLGSLVRTIVSHYALHRDAAVATEAGVIDVRRGGALLDGELLPLSKTGLAVLDRIVQARGGVVSREALLSALPRSTSDLHAVEVAIARVRESAGSPGLIKTVIKRGYRLGIVSEENS